MCAGAAVLARVARVVFGAYDEKAGAVGSLWDVVRDRRLNHRPEVVAGVRPTSRRPCSTSSSAPTDDRDSLADESGGGTGQRPGMTTFDLGPGSPRHRHGGGRGPRRPTRHPTPCPAYSVADLLDHLGGLSVAFTAAAVKDLTPREPSADGSRLEPGFRDRIGAALTALAEAWRAPGAFDGMTMPVGRAA